jgi:hypothetical protein
MLTAGRHLATVPNRSFAAGVVAAGEHLSLSGNPAIAGPVVVGNSGAVSGTVTVATISGDPAISYGCGLSPNIASWPRSRLPSVGEVTG